MLLKRAILVLGIAACHRGAPSSDELLAQSRDQTRAFFALAEAGDCGPVRPVMLHPERCEAMEQDFTETHSHLVSIDKTEIDGRDKLTVLVTVSVQSTRHDHTWIVRAKWTPDGWRMAL